MNKPVVSAEKSWRREPWPWLLASGPLLVVVASFVSAWIAIKSSDGLVSEDAYREGLAVQETISRSEKATALGLVAHVRVTSDTLRVRLSSRATGAGSSNVSNDQLASESPSALRVTISHPTRAGLDQTKLLQRDGAGYSGSFRLPAAGHWLVLIEDDANTWRMMGSVVLPAGGEFAIGQAPEKLPAEVNHP
jgi:hypothetical protein